MASLDMAETGLTAIMPDWKEMFLSIDCGHQPVSTYRLKNYLLAIEELTERRRRPLARRRERTLRPSAVAMRLRKPCLLTRLRFEGWNVRFIAVIDLLCCVYICLGRNAQNVLRCKVTFFYSFPQHPSQISRKIPRISSSSQTHTLVLTKKVLCVSKFLSNFAVKFGKILWKTV